MSATTIVTFVLDESGSMQSIKDDTIGGFNAYLDSLRDDKYGEVKFSLIKFDSRRIDKVYVSEPIKNVVNLTAETYQPGTATPLIDAAYKAIKATENALLTENDEEFNVLVVIQTDGHENASVEHTFKELTALIKAREADGWAFIFLGAGIDAYDMSERMGISAGSTFSYGRGQSQAAFANVTANTEAFRGTGDPLATQFTDEQKAAAGDKHFKPQAPTQPVEDEKFKAVEDFTL